jgi:cyclic pyranopterin phosphate synthase
MAGIEAARAAGLRIKINTVALKGVNDGEIEDIVRWCGDKDMDLTFIETMPMGEIDGHRSAHYLPLSEVRARIEKSWTVEANDHNSGGPARYVTLRESGQRVGFITPLSHNFCESCNRVRLTCTGTLFMCLGQDDAADLRAPLRASDDDAQVVEAIREAISRKPKGHDFIIDRKREAPSISRHMSVTGG